MSRWISIKEQTPPLGEDILYLCWDECNKCHYYFMAKKNILTAESFKDAYSAVMYWEQVSPLPNMSVSRNEGI